MKYDPVQGVYEPQMAQSLTGNATNTEWTLKLRPDVTFSDGTALDAAAVKTSMERQAAKGRSSFLIKDNITSIEVVDPSTVLFKLNKEWAGFPYVLAFHPGMITPPGADAAGDAFAKAPVGAGPYTLAKYAPGDEIVMRARADYWGGKPDIDTLTFKYLAGAQANLDALNSGTFQVSLLGQPDVADAAVKAGMPGWLRINYGGGVTILNVGDANRPTSELKVRQAVAYATDPQILNQRTWAGKAIAGTELYGPSSRWYAGVQGIPYEPDRARQLVTEAKAEGWDGSIEIVASATPPWNNAGLTLQALLQSVGFDVTLSQPATVADQLRTVNVDKAYDMSPTGYALDESEPYVELTKKFSSTSVQNTAGYKSPQMDALLTDLAAADTVDQTKEVIGQIQELMNQDVPGTVWTHNPELLAWVDSVHGIQPTVNAMMLFTEAWVG
jgi:peptide/nickel transport system substrate-binding protein